jgi:CRISPR type III-B/RAMP module RAMP protein Cmr1
MSEKINLANLETEVNKLVKQRLVARIKFKGVTPWWGGDYEGKTSDRIDEDEIVGRLRWFLRTVYNRFCNVNLNNYKDSENKVSEYLGSTECVSLYIYKAKNYKASQNFSYKKLGRVSFVLSDKPPNIANKFEPKDVEFELEILRRGGDNKRDEIVVGGTLITLAFLGVGRGANRGFGRFVPKDCNISIGKEICEKIISGDIMGAFEYFYSKFKQTENCNSVNNWTDSYVPLAPLLDSTRVDSIRKTLCTSNNIITVLDIIQNSVLKVTLKTNSYRTGKFDPGSFIHTWIYGLPRHAKVPTKNPKTKQPINQSSMDLVVDTTINVNNQVEFKKIDRTGYLKVENGNISEPRRQSMFVLSPVKDSSGNYTVYVLAFLSLKDNEEEVMTLVHKGIHFDKNPTIHVLKVTNIMSNSLGSVIKIPNRGSATYMNNDPFFQSEMTFAKRRQDLSFGDVKSLIEKYTEELVNSINSLCPTQGNLSYPFKQTRSRV